MSQAPREPTGLQPVAPLIGFGLKGIDLCLHIPVQSLMDPNNLNSLGSAKPSDRL
jgi:hypothetical protein